MEWIIALVVLVVVIAAVVLAREPGPSSPLPQEPEAAFQDRPGAPPRMDRDREDAWAKVAALKGRSPSRPTPEQPRDR